jgi:hypothetical protein
MNKLPLLVQSTIPLVVLLLAWARTAQAQRPWNYGYRPPPGPKLDGTWYNRANEGKCQIVQRGPDRAVFINENGSRAEGRIDGDRVYVPDWRTPAAGRWWGESAATGSSGRTGISGTADDRPAVGAQAITPEPAPVAARAVVNTWPSPEGSTGLATWNTPGLLHPFARHIEQRDPAQDPAPARMQSSRGSRLTKTVGQARPRATLRF